MKLYIYLSVIINLLFICFFYGYYTDVNEDMKTAKSLHQEDINKYSDEISKLNHRVLELKIKTKTQENQLQSLNDQKNNLQNKYSKLLAKSSVSLKQFNAPINIEKDKGNIITKPKKEEMKNDDLNGNQPVVNFLKKTNKMFSKQNKGRRVSIFKRTLKDLNLEKVKEEEVISIMLDHYERKGDLGYLIFDKSIKAEYIVDQIKDAHNNTIKKLITLISMEKAEQLFPSSNRKQTTISEFMNKYLKIDLNKSKIQQINEHISQVVAENKHLEYTTANKFDDQNASLRHDVTIQDILAERDFIGNNNSFTKLVEKTATIKKKSELEILNNVSNLYNLNESQIKKVKKTIENEYRSNKLAMRIIESIEKDPDSLDDFANLFGEIDGEIE